MPRGVKRSPEVVLEIELNQVEQKIEKTVSQLNKLKAERKSIIKQRKELELAQLHEAITASGKSVKDVLYIFSNKG